MFKLKNAQNMIEGFTTAPLNLSRGSLGSRASHTSSGLHRSREQHVRLGSERPSKDDRDPVLVPRARDGNGSHVAVQRGDIEMNSVHEGVSGKGDAIQVTKSVDLESGRR
jgi:hypothetical protein